jgi:hypothetical protein
MTSRGAYPRPAWRVVPPGVALAVSVRFPAAPGPDRRARRPGRGVDRLEHERAVVRVLPGCGAILPKEAGDFRPGRAGRARPAGLTRRPGWELECWRDFGSASGVEARACWVKKRTWDFFGLGVGTVVWPAVLQCLAREPERWSA